MQKILTLETMIIFPNTANPGLKAFIIAGKDIDGKFYAADTDYSAPYNEFWSDKLTADQKVPTIQLMLNILSLANGEKFRYIQPSETENDISN